jgi:hypothetical protein
LSPAAIFVGLHAKTQDTGDALNVSCVFPAAFFANSAEFLNFAQNYA